ncbi:MAG: phosphatidate cytidylyltransferase [Treponema sp.]|nr:phosphatidate cytidylyltransferase [Treponema sp.]
MAMNLRGGITLVQYRNSILKEVVRKSIHICSSFVPFFLGVAYIPTLIFLMVALVIYCLSESLRVHDIEVPLVAKITAVAARRRDENKFVKGPITLVLGIIGCALLWHPQATAIGIYALAFGDGFASLFGKLFGRVHIPWTKGKTVVGSLVCFFAVFVSSFLVCHNTLYAYMLAFIAMIIEVLPLGDFDNILIPIIVGGIAEKMLLIL